VTKVRGKKSRHPPTADEKHEESVAAFLRGKDPAEAKRYRREQKKNTEMVAMRKYRFVEGAAVDLLDMQSRARASMRPGSTEDVLIGKLDGARLARKSLSQQDLATSGTNAPWEVAKHGHEPPAPKGKKPKGRKTSIQRAAAHARGEIENAVREQVLSILLGVKVSTKRETALSAKLGLEIWSTARKPTRLDLDRLEQAQRAAAMVAAAREFYAQVKRMFPRRSDLEEKLGLLAEINHAWLEWLKKYKLAVHEAVTRRLPGGWNGGEFGDHLRAAAASQPQTLPADLASLQRLAKAILPRTGGALKDLGAERGRNAGGGWIGNITVRVTIAGFYGSGRSAMVNCTRTVEVELLAPERLTVLYAAGPRGGPAEVAKTVAGAILERSRAAVEAMLDQARTAENRDNS
jgi:hypothetical protein